MNKQTRTSLKFQPEAIFGKAISGGYPVAFWRSPGQTEIFGVVDLQPEVKVDEDNLEAMPSGFAFNPFSHHHPSTPSLIKADLLIRWEHNIAPDVQFAPVIASALIDSFLSEDPESHQKRISKSLSESPDYRESVVDAIHSIKRHQLDKVVISRFEDQILPTDFNVFDTFLDGCRRYPNAFVYSLFTPDHGLWMGATPESLLSLKNRFYFETVSLAGTQNLDADQSLNDVAWTQKEIEEQAMVNRYIIECFKKIRLREFTENGPKTVRAGNLAHLKTVYKVDTREIEAEDLSTLMMNLLHPTSAVCGMPLKTALEFIKSHESFDRELYSGFLGPVKIADSTELFVNLRCVKIGMESCRFFAGAGITEDSDPEKEYLETEMKMQTMKRLIFS